MSPFAFLLSAIFVATVPSYTHAHGRVLDPASRMSAYLAGFGTVVDYNDHEKNCGGREIHQRNGLKCGLCGEPYDSVRNYERPNGRYVQHNVITGVYMEGQIMNVTIQITVGHKGYHIFKLCDIATTGGVEATQECLDKTILTDVNGQTKFYYGTDRADFYVYSLKLPDGFSCKHCFLQWVWKCGNDWGCGSEGCCVGCGDLQEYFYACSDIIITPRSGVFDNSTTPSAATTRVSTTPSTTTTTTTTTTTSGILTTLINAATSSSAGSQTDATSSAATERSPTTTTTTISTPTKSHPAPTNASNSRYEIFKKYPIYIPNNNSIKYGPNASNPGQVSGKTMEDILLDIVLGHNTVPSTGGETNYSTPQPGVYDKITMDRLRASCKIKCRFEQCYTYFSDICPR